MNKRKIAKSLSTVLICFAINSVLCSSANAWWAGTSFPSVQVSTPVGAPSGMAEPNQPQQTPERLTIQNLLPDPNAGATQPTNPVQLPSTGTNMIGSNPAQPPMPTLTPEH